MEFKVGDRVRIREDLKDSEEYHGIGVLNAMLDYRGKIATIKGVQGVFYSIDLDEQTWIWTKEMFEMIGKEVIAEFIPNDRLEAKVEVKTKVEIKIEQLEQRIEKLEKCVMGEQNKCEKCENVSSMSKTDPLEILKKSLKENAKILNEPKPSLLTEDERVILRNVDEDFKWIIRNTHQLTITERKPRLEKHGWTVEGGRLADLPYRKLFKFIKFEDDEPYNIEELLKGELENEN